MQSSRKTDVAYWTELSRDSRRSQPPVMTVPISSLQSSDSPRLDGQNIEHVQALAESEVTLPPIIVSRVTMRVIDGMHRLRAAVLRGQDEIEVRLFDGDESDAFVLAVEANITHGLPLSLSDRTAAAARIINSHPQWSDRAIASTTGLAAKTVAAIRRRSSEETPQMNDRVLNARIGRDGRVRPHNAAEGRRIASELMTKRPAASLREVAAAAGISLGTAHDVRERLRRGENPILPKQHNEDQWGVQAKHDGQSRRRATKVAEGTPITDRAMILQNLSRDPSLRHAESGRVLLRLLHVLAIGSRDWTRLIDDLPAHCTPMVSDAARACADAWQKFAEQLEQRGR